MQGACVSLTRARYKSPAPHDREAPLRYAFGRFFFGRGTGGHREATVPGLDRVRRRGRRARRGRGAVGARRRTGAAVRGRRERHRARGLRRLRGRRCTSSSRSACGCRARAGRGVRDRGARERRARSRSRRACRATASARCSSPPLVASAARVGFYGGARLGHAPRPARHHRHAERDRAGSAIHLALPLGVDRAGRIVPLRYVRSELHRAGRRARPASGGRSCTARPAVLRPRGALRYDIAHDGTLSRADLYQARARLGLDRGERALGRPDGPQRRRRRRRLHDRARPAAARPHGCPPRRRSAASRPPRSRPTHTWVVNTTSDAADAHPGDGRLRDRAPGTCSLRAAIDEANRSSRRRPDRLRDPGRRAADDPARRRAPADQLGRARSRSTATPSRARTRTPTRSSRTRCRAS